MKVLFNVGFILLRSNIVLFNLCGLPQGTFISKLITLY